MNSSLLYPKSNTIYPIDYTEFLSNWDWELHMIFYFHELRKYKPVNLDYAIKKVKDFLWRETNKTFRRIKFAGIIVAVQKGSTHCHVVLTSCHNYPRRLTGLSDQSLMGLEDKWEYGGLRVERVYFNQGLCGYLSSGRNIGVSDPDSWSIEFFKTRVLKRLKDK